MTPASPAMLSLAKRLMIHEAAGGSPAGTKIPAAFHACEQLHGQLAILMGSAGFRALLARALVLAATEAPSLRALRVKADGTLEGLAELQAKHGPAEVSRSGLVLLAQLFDLLVAFIGERLTLRLVSEIWPKTSLKDLEPVTKA